MLQTTLHLDALDIRHEGLTKAVAASFREAAEVCFDRHHSPPTTVTIDRGRLINAVVHWNTPDDRTRRAWANQIDTTEAGAYCVALAAVVLTDGLVAAKISTHDDCARPCRQCVDRTFSPDRAGALVILLQSPGKIEAHVILVFKPRLPP